MAKLILRKHQRALVQSFAKYQLDDMIQEDEIDKKRSQVMEHLATQDNMDVFDFTAGG